MKRLLYFLLLLGTSAFSQNISKTDAALVTQANVIANETVSGANTKERIANMHKAEIASKMNVDYAFIAAGSANVYTGTPSNPIVDYDAGQVFVVGIPISNTGASTLNVGSKGVKNILSFTGAALVGGELPANSYVWLVYNGTAFQIIGNSGGGGGSIIGGSGINVSGSTINWNGAISEDVIIPNSGGTHEITIGGDSGGATNRVSALNLYGGTTNFSSISLFNDVAISTTGIIQLFTPAGGTVSVNDNVTLEGSGISVQADASSIELLAATTIDVNAQGPVRIGGNSSNPGRIQLFEDTDLGSQYTEFKVGSQAGNISYTLPTSVPAVNGYVLAGSTAGVLSWVAQSGGGGLVDGDYGDITVGGAGTTMTIDNGVVNDAKIATHTTTKISTTNKALLNSTIVYNDQANTYSDGTVQTFNPSNTNPGFVMGSNSSRPSSPVEGALFFNTTTKDVETYIDGVWSGMTRGEDITDATTARTITDSDRNKTVIFTSSSPITVTLNGTPEVNTAVCIWKAVGSGIITISASGSLKAVSNQMLTDNTGAWFVHEGGGVWRGMGALGSVASGTFVGLTDGPGAFTGKTLNYPRVNAGETALEYRTPAQVRSDIGAGTGSGDALTTNPLSQFASTTSAQLRGVLSDEVGTGAAYFIGGALSTPASGSAINLTGLPIDGGTTGTLPINRGGTNGVTAQAAFNNLSPLTTQGDIIFHDGTNNTRLAKNGSAGRFLSNSGTSNNPAWAQVDASVVVNTPAGNIISTTIQAAINELDTEKQDALGYIPVNPANNGTDFSSASTTLQNLGGMEKTSVKNVQTGDYTLQASDFNTNTTIYMDNGSTPRTLTIPLAALSSVPTIRTVLVRRLGTASVTIVGAVGTTINPPGGSNTDPGQGYLFAISKDGVGAATYTIDNGGVALGPANSLLAVNNAGTIQEYKAVSNGITAAAGTLKLGGALTADTGLTGAFSLGVGTASPAAKLDVIGLGAGTGVNFRLADNANTTRLSVLDNGKATWTNAQSGASSIGYQWNNNWTATANSQTNTGFDLFTTSTVGAFTGTISNYIQVRDNTAGTLFSMSSNGGMVMNGMILYDFKNGSNTSVVRNSAAAIALRGGTSSSTRSVQIGVNNASSTNNNVALNFTGSIHDIVAGAQTRVWTGILNDVSVSAGDGNNITYIMNNNIPSFSMGNSSFAYTFFDYNPSITATGTQSHTAFRVRSGLSGFGVGSTLPTAYMHLGAGSTANAPMRYTSGALTTSGNILAGNHEFLTDKWYGTITTGTAQKEFTMNDAALTSGTFPVATTNGRLTDSGLTTSNLKAIYSGGFSGAGTATTTFTVTIGATLGATTYEAIATPSNVLSAAVFYITNKTTTTFDVVYLAGLTGTVAFDWVVTP